MPGQKGRRKEGNREGRKEGQKKKDRETEEQLTLVMYRMYQSKTGPLDHSPAQSLAAFCSPALIILTRKSTINKFVYTTPSVVSGGQGR